MLDIVPHGILQMLQMSTSRMLMDNGTFVILACGTLFEILQIPQDKTGNSDWASLVTRYLGYLIWGMLQMLPQ